MSGEAQKAETLNCEAVQEILSAFLDGELEPDQASLVQEHLRACANCRSELEVLRRLDALARQSLVTRLPARFSRELRTRVKDEVRRRFREVRAPAHGHRRFGFALAATVAVLIAAVSLSLHVWQGRRSSVVSWVGSSLGKVETAREPAGAAVGQVSATTERVGRAAGAGAAGATSAESGLTLQKGQATPRSTSGKSSRKEKLGVAREGVPSSREAAQPSAVSGLVKQGSWGSAPGHRETGLAGGKDVAALRKQPARPPKRAIVPTVIGPPARYPLRTAALDSLRQLRRALSPVRDPIELISWGLSSEDTRLQRLASQAVEELVAWVRVHRDRTVSQRLRDLLRTHRLRLTALLGEAVVDSLTKELAGMTRFTPAPEEP